MNSLIIIQAVGFSGNFTERVYFNESINGSNFTYVTDVYPVLFKNTIGGLILSMLGLIPGYWVCVFTIDRIGRKPIQIIGFSVLTILLIVLASAYDSIIHYSSTLFIVLFTIAQFFGRYWTIQITV